MNRHEHVDQEQMRVRQDVY